MAVNNKRCAICLQDDECKVRAPHTVSGSGPQDGDASRLDVPSTHPTRNLRLTLRHASRQVSLHAHFYVSPACYPLTPSTPRITTLSYLRTVHSILYSCTVINIRSHETSIRLNTSIVKNSFLIVPEFKFHY